MRSEQILFPLIRVIGDRPRLAQALLGRDRWGNPLSPEIIADPYVSTRLADPDGPVVYRALYQQWFVHGYDEIRELLARTDLEASAQIETLLAIRPYTRLSERSRFFLRHFLPVTDPPTHTRLRGLVNRAFTPRRIAAIEPAVERLTKQLLDELPTSGPIDIRAGLTVPLPINVIADMLGVPEQHWDDICRWTTRVLNLVEPLVRWDPAEADEAFDNLYDLYTGLADQRRAEPTDDLLSALVEATEDGDRLTNDELVSMIAALMTAGFETTSGLLGSSIVNLARHPEQRQLLIDRPELWPNAVEELLRYDTPVKVLPRRSTVPFELGGHQIPAGANLMASIVNGHRDPRRYDDPYSLRLDRDDPRPLAFGHGMHHCVGAALARLELRVGLQALLARHPDYELERVEWRRSMNLRNQSSLIIRPSPGR